MKATVSTQPNLSDTMFVILICCSTVYNAIVLPLSVILWIVKQYGLERLPIPWPIEILLPFIFWVIAFAIFTIVATIQDTICTIEIAKHFDPSLICLDNREYRKIYSGQYVFQIILTFIWYLECCFVLELESVLNLNCPGWLTFRVVFVVNTFAIWFKLLMFQLIFAERMKETISSKHQPV